VDISIATIQHVKEYGFLKQIYSKVVAMKTRNENEHQNN
jgi:hypothetical protein